MNETAMSNEDTIRAFIQDTFFVDHFERSDSFLRNGLIDSTGMLELVVFVEKTFGIKVEDGELLPENLDALDKVTRFVERKLSQSRGT